MTRDGPTTIPKTSLQQLKALMVLWLADNPIQVDVLDMIQPEVSAFACRLNNTMDECYNNEMLEKATMQIER